MNKGLLITALSVVISVSALALPPVDISDYVPDIPKITPDVTPVIIDDSWANSYTTVDANLLFSPDIVGPIQRYLPATAARDYRAVAETLGQVDWAAWNIVYSTYANVSYEVKPVSAAKVITEVRMPKKLNEWLTLSTNLRYYLNLGYNAALVVVTGEETPAGIASLCSFVQGCGMRVWLTFGGAETLFTPIHIDPVKLHDLLKAGAARAETFLCAWRRTSAHLVLQDTPYMNYLVHCVREGNPNIGIVGEFFYGEHYDTATYKVTKGTAQNIPDAAGAVMLQGVGFANANYAGAISRASNGKPVFACVVGVSPYYLSRNNSGYAEHAVDKYNIEQKFLKAGCVGVVTMADDGSDGRYNSNVSNNLSAVSYTAL